MRISKFVFKSILNNFLEQKINYNFSQGDLTAKANQIM